mgnify:CR=1 FL=1
MSPSSKKVAEARLQKFMEDGYCDDENAFATTSDGIEVCDGDDNDCDGSVDEGAVDETVARVREVMEAAAEPAVKIDVPLVVDAGQGANWAEAH